MYVKVRMTQGRYRVGTKREREDWYTLVPYIYLVVVNYTKYVISVTDFDCLAQY